MVNRDLCIVPKLLGWGYMWAMLWVPWRGMFKLCEKFICILWHADVYMVFVIVPFEAYSTIKRFCPIFIYLVVLL
jgi:hypothetical protein